MFRTSSRGEPFRCSTTAISRIEIGPTDLIQVGGHVQVEQLEALAPGRLDQCLVHRGPEQRVAVDGRHLPPQRGQEDRHVRKEAAQVHGPARRHTVEHAQREHVAPAFGGDGLLEEVATGCVPGVVQRQVGGIDLFDQRADLVVRSLHQRLRGGCHDRDQARRLAGRLDGDVPPDGGGQQTRRSAPGGPRCRRASGIWSSGSCRSGRTAAGTSSSVYALVPTLSMCSQITDANDRHGRPALRAFPTHFR